MRPAILLMTAAFVVPASWSRADHRVVVDQLVQPLLDEKIIVSCVVGIISPTGQEQYGYGETWLDGGDPPSNVHLYEIGSITKAFTGTLLADMVNRGELKLDTPLRELLPPEVKLHELPGHPIRLVDVASQSSGLPRMPSNFAPADPNNPYVDYDAKKMFAFLGDYQLGRPPGEYEYSNFGMGLLGELLARHAGKSYEQLVIERICEPLEMHDTGIKLTDDQQRRLALPYNGERSPGYNWEFDAIAGAGALRSTCGDMLRLVRAALAEGDRPVVAALQTAFEKQFANRDGTAVGLGWQIGRDGVTRWHNGQTGGYSSVVYIHRPSRQGVVVLANTPSELIWPLGEKILQSMLGTQPDPLPVRTAITLSPDQLAKFTGRYTLSSTEEFRITLADGQLMAQLTGQPKWRLFPESDRKFFYRVVDAQITFQTNDDGQITKLILHQNGLDQPAPRVAEP